MLLNKLLKFAKWSSPFFLMLAALYLKDIFDQDVVQQKNVENSLRILVSDTKNEELIQWAYQVLELNSDTPIEYKKEITSKLKKIIDKYQNIQLFTINEGDNLKDMAVRLVEANVEIAGLHNTIFVLLKILDQASIVNTKELTPYINELEQEYLETRSNNEKVIKEVEILFKKFGQNLEEN